MWENIVGFLDIVTKSDFALAIVLLLVVALCVVTINNMVSHIKHELHVALLECREDSLKDMRFNNSLVALAGKYQLVVFNFTSNRGIAPPPEVEELRRELTDLRHSMHAETNRRVTRVEDTRKLLATQYKGKWS